MNILKRWLRNIMDPDWLVNNAKALSFVIFGGIILCLGAIFILQSQSNIKSGAKDITAEREKVIEEQQKIASDLKNKQQELITKTQTTSLAIDNLKYKAPNTEGTVDAFLNTNDFLVGYSGNHLLMSTAQEKLYFYNLEDGTTSDVTKLALYQQLSNGNLYYVHVEDAYTHRLVRYNIESKDKTGIITLNPTLQSISGALEKDGKVYYILISSGKSYLQSYNFSNPTDREALAFNIPLPADSYLRQEGDNVYMINKSGFYILKENKLEKLSDVPQVEFMDIQVWNGKPLIYGYNNQTKTGELYYEGKLLVSEEEITDIQPLDDTYLLMNEHHHLVALNKDTLEKKEIAEDVISAVSLNGDFVVSKSPSMAAHSDKQTHTTSFYYFSKTK